MRNPCGRRGSPAHQSRIVEVRQKLEGRGWETTSGGGGPEIKVGNRYPDLTMRKGDKRIVIQVGRATKSGQPIDRERRAIRDLRNSGEFNHVFFLRYE